MPTVTIDGHEIEVEAGTRVIEACDRLGIRIPRFCYHPGLSVAANCRMCVVETNRSQKLVPSCYEQCQDGLIVKTNTPRVREARRSVLEFILLNHPVDCPICDQAGECALQDLYFQYDLKPSRHAFRKLHKPKARVIGPQVIYDAERCINCTRCIRVCDEVIKAPQLRQVQRGERTYIDVFPGRELDNPYSLLTTDVCPVGALTSRDFRFKCRVWFLSSTWSLCGECSRVCAIRVDTFDGTIQRVVPRFNPLVNGHWACDHGRLAFHRYESSRTTKAMVRGNHVDYAPAIKALADELSSFASDTKVAVILTPFLTCEDTFAIVTFIRARFPNATFSIGGRDSGKSDGVLVRSDKNPNRAGILRVLSAYGIGPAPLAAIAEASNGIAWVFGEEHAEGFAIPASLVASKLAITITPLESPLSRNATFVLPMSSPYESEGTWLNEFGILQRLRQAVQPVGDSRQAWQIISDVAERMGLSPPATDIRMLFEGFATSISGPKSLDDIGPYGVKLV